MIPGLFVRFSEVFLIGTRASKWSEVHNRALPAKFQLWLSVLISKKKINFQPNGENNLWRKE